MTTILLIHGIPGSARTWHRVVAALENDHDVLHPDSVGFGGSNDFVTADDLLAPNQARALGEQLDRRDVGRVVLVGHDFGGPVAAHLIAADPSRVATLARVTSSRRSARIRWQPTSWP